MDRRDEYRSFAREAQAMAYQTRDPTDKASWLQIAQKWLDLLAKPGNARPTSLDDSSK